VRRERATARLFFALWPEPRVQQALGALAQAAQAQCGGRAIPAEKTHVTLFFLGNVELERIGALKALAGAIAGERFELSIDRVGYWRHNRIVWAGIAACPPPLARLASALESALGAIGYEKEERRYVPHVTLVRNAKRGPQKLHVTPIEWSVREFALVDSVQAAGVARYDVIARYPLLV